jgi:hypothetical protein
MMGTIKGRCSPQPAQENLTTVYRFGFKKQADVMGIFTYNNKDPESSIPGFPGTPTTSGSREALCGLLSAKGGLMMGTKKVGALSSPRKKAIPNIRLP